jgi:membrane-associated protease RseP (regulator of RpoE activity)
MLTTAWKAVPLSLLLLASWALPAGANDDPPQKKEKKVIVTDDDVVVSGKDEPGDETFVWRWPGRSRRGYLGVRLLEMTPELRAHFGAPKDAGVMVAGVEKDSPAAKAGVQVGDIVTRADGERIESGSDLSRAVRRRRSGDSVKLEVSRDRAAKFLNVKVEERRVPEMDMGDLGDLGREIGRSVGRDIGRRAWVLPTPPTPPADLNRLRDRLEELEKRLNDLEKRLPAR